MDPKLLIIRSDGSGSEFLSERQLSNYFKMKQKELNQTEPNYESGVLTTSKKFEMEKLLGMENSRAVSYLTKMVRQRNYLQKLSFINGIEIPRVIDNLQQSIVIQKEPPLNIFYYRCILIHPELNPEKREIFNKDMEKYRQWKENQEKIRKSLVLEDIELKKL